ncbi:MAG: hypothetical protein HON90_02110 [Halobacteriovoraceae bacterium]|jgi:hypothetical protein|nr:hypothetical protein [Halobacteriovoraceae bacterium]
MSRRLNEIDPILEKRYFDSFEQIFVDKDSGQIIKFCEELTKDFGGLIFEGYSSDAPKDWKLPLKSTD